MDPNDMFTWNAAQLRNHAVKELNNSGMVEIYNHQTLGTTGKPSGSATPSSISGTTNTSGSPSTAPI